MTRGYGEPSPVPADVGEERRYRSVRGIDPEAPGALRSLLDALSDASWRVRHAAADLLARSDPVRTVPSLVAALGVDSTPGRRHAAAEALVQLGASAVRALTAALGDPAPEVRTAALEILGDIGDRGATAAVAARLDDGDANARVAAAEALGKIGGQGAAEVLRRTVALARDVPLRGAALDALVRLRAPPEPAILLDLSRRPEFVRAALRLAGTSDGSVALEILARGLEGARGVRDAALAGIGEQRLRHQSAPEALLGVLRATVARSRDLASAAAIAAAAGETAVRAGAVAVLESTRDPSHAAAIVAAAEDDRVRGLTAEALDALGPIAAVTLLAALPRLAPTAAVVALGALARWRDPRAFPHLLVALGSDDGGVRGAAIEALGRLGDVRAVAPLMSVLEGGDPAASGAAIGALGDLARSGSEAMERVREACRSHRSPRPPAVERILARIGSGGEIQPVRDLRQRERLTRAAAAPSSPDVARGDAPGEVGAPALDPRAMTPDEFRLLRDLIYQHCGLSFGDDLAYLLQSRLGPRLRYHGLGDFTAYYRLLRYDAARASELEAAVEALTTRETYLYREPQQLRAFSEEILPALARRNARQRRLRIWSAGCSTGEEAYTIAILTARTGLFEEWDVEVFGSDIVRRVVAVARAGAYGARAFRTSDADALRPWFRAEGDTWHANDAIRRLVSFGHLNLLDPAASASIGTMDVIFCRNVLIYFDIAARRRVVRTFESKLREGGYLLLGHSESLLNVTGDFELVHLRNDLVYRKPFRSA